jgi:hypothetical protein
MFYYISNYYLNKILNCWALTKKKKLKEEAVLLYPSSQNTIQWNNIFFSISILSFNIRFIKDWTLYFFSIYFLWVYSSLMTQTVSFVS